MLKGALVGAGALAFMALPTPLNKLVTAMAPAEAFGANNNVADGIYVFRYNANVYFSLDVPDASATKTNIQLGNTNASISQAFSVKYDSSTDAYSLTPICGMLSNMVLTATASKNEVVKMRADQGLTNQRWIFTKNPNGSYGIKCKAATSLCLNLTNDNRIYGAGIHLFPYSSTDTASQWDMLCMVPAHDETVTYLTNKNQVFESDFLLENVRTNYPEIVSMPSGWSIVKKDGHPWRIAYKSNAVYRKTSPASFVIKYPNVADLNGVAVDFQVKIDVYCDYNEGKFDSLYSHLDSWSTGTHVDLKWADGNSGCKSGDNGFFAGICVISSSWFDVTYSCYNHSTGEQISMVGAYMTFTSLNGAAIPGNDGQWESVSYQSSKDGAKCWVMKGNYLFNPCSGLWSGVNQTSKEWEDVVGGKNIEYVSVSHLIQDVSPRFRFTPFATSCRNGLWSYPILSPLGILEPGNPEKTAEIQG